MPNYIKKNVTKNAIQNATKYNYTSNFLRVSKISREKLFLEKCVLKLLN